MDLTLWNSIEPGQANANNTMVQFGLEFWLRGYLQDMLHRKRWPYTQLP
jgi:hypothetical protein